MAQVFCRCPGCSACGTSGGTHNAAFTRSAGSVAANGTPRCPACTASQAAAYRSQAGPQFLALQRQAEQLEARAARADELEHRLEVHEPDIYGPGGGYRHSWWADIARVTKSY